MPLREFDHPQKQHDTASPQSTTTLLRPYTFNQKPMASVSQASVAVLVNRSVDRRSSGSSAPESWRVFQADGVVQIRISRYVFGALRADCITYFICSTAPSGHQQFNPISDAGARAGAGAGNYTLAAGLMFATGAFGPFDRFDRELIKLIVPKASNTSRSEDNDSRQS